MGMTFRAQWISPFVSLESSGENRQDSSHKFASMKPISQLEKSCPATVQVSTGTLMNDLIMCLHCFYEILSEWRPVKIAPNPCLKVQITTVGYRDSALEGTSSCPALIDK